MALGVVLKIALVGLGLYFLRSRLLQLKNGKQAPLPPGPKPSFLVGNLSDLPRDGELEFIHWLKHKDLYGPISSVTVMGQTIVIINEARIAFELLEKRSSKHSSRPKQIFAGEMIGWENSLGGSPYSNQFRAHRKYMSRIIGSKNVAAQFNDLQVVEVGHFLLRVLENPDGLVEHIRKEAGAVILKIIYGYTVEPHDKDALVDLIGEAMDQFGQAAVPGAWLVDIMPFMRHLPDWFPGTGFKRTAEKWKNTLIEAADKPFAFVKHQMARGQNEISFLSRLLEQGDLSPENSLVKWSALSLYAGGADTTVSSLAWFFLAMTVYPDVQRKAQEEIDRVIGSERLPGFEDRENLPYIDAIVKEILRWNPVGPMGLPHMTTEDDIYEGYLIPKGAVILANIWYFCHDPSIYHDPMAFKPERYLSPTPEPDPHSLAFGFGRRVCPGRILAENSLYLSIVQSLAVFKISKAVDQTGKEIDPVVSPQAGIVCHPNPFKTNIKPRSERHETLIQSIEQIHPWEESDANVLEGIKILN
ncbi:hypothetical protein DTO212C5_5890 [Paecilomyces variotii]|nr:hypothetical protein DTO212C5_5890 [Paecilomyces variotii]